jgi:hypothetical protein
VPYKAKSRTAASHSTERNDLYGFLFHKNKNAKFLIVDKSVMHIQGFGGKI